jgi:hypothetical protein
LGGNAVRPITPDIGLPGVLCERALTVAGNVVVDVRSCSPNVGDTAATFARDIVGKINGRWPTAPGSAMRITHGDSSYLMAGRDGEEGGWGADGSETPVGHSDGEAPRL